LLRNRKPLVRVLVGAALIGGIFGSLTSAQAMGWGDGCNPGRGSKDNYETHYKEGYFLFDGNWQQDPVYDTEAQILEYSPYVNAHHISSQEVGGSASAWVMLENGNANCVCSYAQAGWLEYPYTSRHEFIEYTDYKGGHWTQQFPNNNTGAIVNNYVNYRVEYNPNDGLLRFYFGDVNSGNQDVAHFPLKNLGWTPNIALDSGEIASYPTQMPGGTGFNENFWWPEIGTIWNTSYHISNNLSSKGQSSPTNNFDNNSAFGMYPANASNLYNVNYFGIWDGACSH